jgi:hypothetical protein
VSLRASFFVLANHAGVATLNNMEPPAPSAEITLGDLFPKLNETDLPKAEASLDEYLALALRIWTRLQADPKALATFEALTASQSRPTIEPTRFNPKPSQTA